VLRCCAHFKKNTAWTQPSGYKEEEIKTMTEVLGEIRYNIRTDGRHHAITLVRTDEGKIQLEIGEYKESGGDGVFNVYDVNDMTIN
jgi:hypothetical protein